MGEPQYIFPWEQETGIQSLQEALNSQPQFYPVWEPAKQEVRYNENIILSYFEFSFGSLRRRRRST